MAKNALQAKGSQILRNACLEFAIKGTCKFRFCKVAAAADTKFDRDFAFRGIYASPVLSSSKI